MSEPTHFVKVRKIGQKSWAFLATGGATNRLRVHALRFSLANAERLVAENRDDNPEWEWRIDPIDS